MNDERLGIAYIGKIGEDFEVVDEFSGCLKSVFQFNGENGICALRQVFFLQFMIWRRFEARIVDLCYLWMSFQVFSHLRCVVDMSFYTEGQCFKTLDKEPCGDRGNGCTGVSQHLGTDSCYEAGSRDIRCKIDSMIGCIWFCKVRISFRLVPVEFSVFNNSTAECRAVSADELCRGMDGYVKSVFQRTE